VKFFQADFYGISIYRTFAKHGQKGLNPAMNSLPGLALLFGRLRWSYVIEQFKL